MWDRLLVGEGAAVGQVGNQPGVQGNPEQDGAAASEKPRSKYKPIKQSTVFGCYHLVMGSNWSWEK